MRTPLLLALLAASADPLSAWGLRAHQAVNRVAVRAIPGDGPAFLRNHEDWIVHLAIVPDTWRSPADPALKILEDPNHGWFKEQFSFLKEIPRSRYEFVLALYEEHKRLLPSDPERARLTNVRWTGTLPYAAQESYERMKAAMRRYRAAASAKQDTRWLELEIASSFGRLGHYLADAAMPLHASIHHDGWQGPNPNEYTRDPRIHGRFESAFVELIELQPEDFAPRVSKPLHLNDPFLSILAHLDRSASHVETVYQLDKSGALADKANEPARRLVYDSLASASAILRDLACTAWTESAQPVRYSRENNPVDPKHPRYNPATGSAPPAPPAQ